MSCLYLSFPDEFRVVTVIVTTLMSQDIFLVVFILRNCFGVLNVERYSCSDSGISNDSIPLL